MITKAHSSSSEQGAGRPISGLRMQIEMGISRAATHCGPGADLRSCPVCIVLFPAL